MLDRSSVMNRGSVRVLLVGPMMTAASLPAWAGPEGQQVVAGSATFARNGALTTITAANKTIINYSGFNIAGHETVRFIQPDASSRVLNRINGGSPTQIDGSLIANGIVYIVNPAGVVFSQGAMIDVGGLHAAAASMTNSDFTRGIDRFTDAQGSVINRGTIVSPEVTLFGRAVENTGSVISPNGVVAFVAGEDLYLGERGGNLYIKVEGVGGEVQAGGVQNLGSVSAPGGKVMVGSGDMFGVMLASSSRIAAKDVSIRGGSGAITSISGSIDASASAPGATGGSVDVRGDRVGLFDATINASGPAGGGDVRIGGDFHGGSGERASRTYVSEGSSIRADATKAGDGGSVVVWSDEVTRFAGQISARGAGIGAGGEAEVSGKDALLYTGFADLRSSNGAKGTLLLDPKNIIIETGGADTLPGNTAFTDVSTLDRTFSPATIEAGLDGANLTLQANNDITINDDVDASGNAGVGDLTLQAGRSVIIDADVTLRGSFSATANDTDVLLVAAERDGGAATITMTSGRTIDTSATGGDITLRVLEGGAADTSASTMTIASLNAGAGDVLARYAGPTANQGIQRADGASTITAATAAFATNGAGGGGFVGTSAEPVQLSVDNLEAVAQRNGAFFANDKDLVVGGAALGGLTGISVTSAAVSGDLGLDVAGAINVTEAIATAGTAAILATDGVTLNANVTTNSVIAGTSTINSDSDDDNNTSANPDALVVANGFVLNSSGNDLALTVGDLDINATGSINTGAGNLSIVGSAAADLIGIGSGVAGNDITISSAELANITVNNLTIGDAGSTAMQVGGVAATDLPGVGGTIELASDNITFQSDAEFPNVTARATDSVIVQGNLSTATGDLVLQGDSDSIAGGTDNVQIAANLTLGANVGLDVSATNGISLSGGAGTLVTFAGETVTLSDVASAASNVRIQAGGNIAASDVSIGAGTLAIELDAGDVGTFTADVGQINAGSVSVAAGSNDNVTFTGTITTSLAGGVDIDGGAITFQDDVTANGTGIVRVTNVGVLSITESAPIVAGGGFTQDGTGAVSLGANITTTGDPVSFLRAVTLADTTSDLVTIDTTNGGANAAGANVTFSSTTNATSAGAQSLTINGGTGGDILFTGGVGSLARMGTLRVQNARNVTATLAVQANAIEQVAGTGLTTFSSTVSAIGGGIDLNGQAFTFSNTVNSASGGVFSVTNAGALIIGPSAAITATGGFIQDGAGAVSLGANITTTGDAVSFAGATTLTDTASDLVTIDTTSGPAPAGGNVSFGSTLNAAVAGGQSLNINAGTGGDATFAGAVGTTRLGTLTITNARDFIASSTVSANAIRQVAGQRLTRFDGVVTTSTASGVDLDGTGFTFNDDVTANSSGIVRITNSGLLTIAEGAPITADGGVTQDGAGGISLGANVTTTGDAISFSGPVTLADTATDLVTIDTTSGSAAGANVSFGSTLTGTGAGVQSLTVNAGTGGDATFTGAIGSTRIGTLTVTNARDFIASSTMTAAAIRQLAGQRLTRFDGIVNTSAAAGVDLDGSAFTINDDVTSTGAGIFRVTNSGLLTIADGAPILAQGGFTQDGAGAISLGANITTNGTAVSMLRAVTLADTAADLVTINTTNGGSASGANVLFSSTIDGAAAGAQSLAVNAGTGGDVTFTGAVGGATRVGTLTITNAEDVIASSTIAAGAIRQVAGQQLTRFDGVIDTATAAGIDLDGSAFTFNDDVTTTGSGLFRVTNSGALTIATTAPVVASGAVTQDGAGAVSIGANVLGSGVAFSGPSTLAAPVTLTGGTGGVSFGSTLATGGNALTISSGGDVGFGGAVTGAGATLLIRPTLASTPIDLGTITGGSAAGTMTLSAASAANLDGFSAITIGFDPSVASHAIRAGTVAFNDPVTARTGSAGSIEVRDGGITGAGDSTVTLIGATTLNAGISNPGRGITVNGTVQVGQGSTAAISTGAGAGNIVVTGDIDGTAGGASEALTLTAGTGTIDLQGNVSGVDGAADATGLTSLTFGSAAGVDVQGIAITGPLTTTSALTGPFVADATVSVGSLDMDGTAFTFTGGLFSTGGVSITNSGLLTLVGGLTTNGAIEFTGPALLGGVFDSTDNTIMLGGPVTLTTDSEFDAGTSTFTLGASGSIDTDGNALTLTADDMVLASAAGSISSGGDGGAVIIQPATATRGISLSSPTTNPAVGFLGLSTAEVATLAGGFDSVTIGRADGRHEIRVGTLSFSDPLTIRTPVGGSVFVGNAGITGSDNASILIDGSGATTTLAANITTDGDDIVISDSVLVAANVVLSTGAATAGDVTIAGTIDQIGTSPVGTFGLTALAGTGSVNLQSATGANRAIASLTATGADINVASIGGSSDGVSGATALTATNALSLTGSAYRSGSLSLQGGTIAVQTPLTTVASSTGAVEFTGPVALADDADLDVNAATNATFSSTVDGTASGPTEVLNVVAGGLADFNGAIGAGSPVHSLGVSANTVDLGAVTTTTSQTIEGTAGVTLGADLTSIGNGGIAVTGPVTLGGPVTITSAGAIGDDIAINGTVNGAAALSIAAGAGDAALNGVVGATTALDSLTVTAANIALEAIGAAGEGVSGITSIVGTTSVTFNGLIYRANQQTYSAPAKTLAAGLTQFFASGDSITLSGGSTDLTGSTGLSMASLNGAISTDSLVGTAAGQTISIDSGTGAATLGGIAIRSGGGVGPAITLTGDEIDITGAVAGSTIVLQPSTPSLGINIASGASGAPLNLTIAELGFLADGFTQITIGREDNGAHAIVTGPITFRDPVRILTPFGGSVSVNSAMVGSDNASILIDGPDATTTLNAGITTNGNDITIDDSVIVGANVAISTQGGVGAPKGGDITITGTTNGANTLTLDAGLGAVLLQSLVGGSTPLASFVATGGSITVPGVSTTGLQAFNGSTIATGATPSFTTGGTAGDDISFNGTLDASGNLVANAGTSGIVTFASDVGGTTRPTSLVSTGAGIRFGGSQVRTVGLQDHNGAATTFDAGAGLPGTIVFSTDGGSGASIDFSSTLDGANNLVINAGARSVVLAGVVGGSTPFSSVDISGSPISTVGVNSVGTQIFRGPVSVTASDATFATADGGNIAFQQSLNGASSVTARAPLGQITFGAPVGGTTPLQSIDAQAATINLANTNTIGSQRFIGSNSLGSGAITLTTGGGAGANITLGAVDGAQNLTLNAGSLGDIALTQPVGASTALLDLVIANARNVSTGAVTARSISQVAGAGLSAFSGLLSSSGVAGIDLNGTAFDVLGGMNAGGSGSIAVTNTGQLRLPASSAVAYGGSFTQDGPGGVLLGTNLVNGATPISFSGPIGLTGNVVLEGSQISLAQDVNASGGARSLEVRSTGDISLAGVGNGSPLSSFTIRDLDGTAISTLGGDINADGFVSIETPILLSMDIGITGLGGVAFGSTIDAAPSLDAGLTVQTETLAVNLPSNPETIPIIELGGDIGATRALSHLEFNPIARDTVPQIATIVSRQGISIDSGTRFEMGRNDKLTALGDINISADQAILGDLSALGDISVQAGSITILTRDGGTIVGPQAPGTDQGVDFVAKDRIDFSTTPTLDPDGLVFFATQSGGGFSPSLSGFSQRAFGSVDESQFFKAGTTLVLDLRAQGPTNTNVSEAIAGAAPRESQSGNVRRGTSIGGAQEDQLREIGVDPRGLDVQTLVEALVGRAVYDDLPEIPDYKPRDTRITESRLTQSVVTSALQTVAEVLGENNSERRAQLKEHLLNAADAYLETTDEVRVTDGVAFRRFVESSPEHSDALADLQGLERLFAQLRLLALTDFELEKAWQQISSSITDRRLPPTYLRQAVEPNRSISTDEEAEFDEGTPIEEPPVDAEPTTEEPAMAE